MMFVKTCLMEVLFYFFKKKFITTLPTLWLKPYLVIGTPVFIEILVFSPERPVALFQDHENPNFFPIKQI